MSEQISEIIDVEGGEIEVLLRGEGPLVVLIPSLGRGGEDFDDLSSQLATAGYQIACPQPRGIGRTEMPLDGMTMTDLANDVAHVISAFSSDKAVVVGHAFGQRVARMTATEHPERVDSVVLMACGGLILPDPDITEALIKVFDIEASDSEHLEYVRVAFFAAGNDPDVWFDGWNGVAAYFQGQATANTDVSLWWSAGSCPVLIMQPEEDVTAVPENANRLVSELGNRATLVTVPNAGHALLPEKPKIVAETVLQWLNDRNLL